MSGSPYRDGVTLAANRPPIDVHPLTPDRWDDLVDLFGPERGANSGCWCMWWRMSRADWKAVPREEKRDRFRAIVEGRPAARRTRLRWRQGRRLVRRRPAQDAAAVEPLARRRAARGRRGRLRGELLLHPLRLAGQKLMRTLLDGALDFAAKQGAAAVEACPIDTRAQARLGRGLCRHRLGVPRRRLLPKLRGARRRGR